MERERERHKEGFHAQQLTYGVCEVIADLHGEDGCDGIQGGNDDANLTNASCEQKGPCGLPVGFAVPKHLQQHGRTQ